MLFYQIYPPAGRFLAPPQYSRDTDAKPMPVLTNSKGRYPINISVRFLQYIT